MPEQAKPLIETLTQATEKTEGQKN
jgi:hypothetical protein